MINLYNITVYVSVILAALIAGLFYSYSCSVNGGLAKLNDSEYIKAMQAINVAILNPVFFVSFIGTLLFLPASTWFAYQNGNTEAFNYFLSASILYLIGVFGVTAFGNVPLNDNLAKFDLTNAVGAEIANARAAFESPWNRLNLIRTIASIIVLALALVGFKLK